MKDNSNDAVVKIDIDPATLKKVTDYGKDAPLYARVTEKGFMCEDRFFSQLEGRFVDIYLVGVQWDGKELHRVPYPDDGALPDGFNPRARVKMLINGQAVVVTVSKWSWRFRLSKYVSYLDKSGLKPSEVITRISVTRENNRYGSFNALRFEVVARVVKSDPGNSYPAETAASPAALPPQPVQENPWA